MNGFNNNSVEADSSRQPRPRLDSIRRRSTQPTLINLSNIPQDLSLNRGTSRGKSISFSGISYVIDQLLTRQNTLDLRSDVLEEIDSAVNDHVLAQAIQQGGDNSKICSLIRAAIASNQSDLALDTLPYLEGLGKDQHYNLLHIAAAHGMKKDNFKEAILMFASKA